MEAKYPSRSEAATRFAVLLTRAPMLCALATHALFPLYLRLIASLGWSNALVSTVLVAVTHTATYVSMNGFFALCDAKGWFSRYKLPRKKSQLPTRELIVATLKQAAVGQILVSPLVAYGLYKYVLQGPPQDKPLPSILETWAHFAAATLVNEVGFYSAHRMFHEVPWLYQKIHKQHHKFVGTTSIAAEYAALPEEIVAASLPTMSYMLYMQVPNLVLVVWVFNRLFETYESHSGYCFRGAWPARWFGLLNAERVEFHDYHHTANVGNYGTHVFMDYLFGTMTSYLLSKQRAALAEAASGKSQ